MSDFLLDEEEEKEMMAPAPSLDPEQLKAAREESDRQILYANLMKAGAGLGAAIGTPGQKADTTVYDSMIKQADNPINDLKSVATSQARDKAMLQKYLLNNRKLDYLKNKDELSKVESQTKAQKEKLEDVDKFTGKVRDDYLKQSKLTQDMEGYYNNVKRAAAGGSAASDINLTFAIMKLYDPNSTVREGETATVASAGSVPERILKMYNSALTGEKLTPEMRADFLKTARDRLTTQYESQDAIDSYWKNIIANKEGANPDLVLMKRNINLNNEGLSGPTLTRAMPGAKNASAQSIPPGMKLQRNKKTGETRLVPIGG